jgi:anti-repressor protein
MNALTITTTTSAQTMSSLEIAELTGKEHRNVMRDIRAMLDDLEITQLSFERSYRDSTGRALPCFELPKRETLILVSGYSVALRARIIDRWAELEQAVATRPALPATYLEALKALTVQVEETERVQAEVVRLAPRGGQGKRETSPVERPHSDPWLIGGRAAGTAGQRPFEASLNV